MVKIILISLSIGFFVLIVSAILFGKKNNSNKIVFNKKENAQHYNEMRNILLNYETLSEEQDDKYLKIIVDEKDEHDKKILSAMYHTLHERVYPIGHGGSCDIMLLQDETLVWKHKSMSLSKVKVISKFISGVGYRQTKNGLRFFTGDVSVYPNEQMVMVETLCTIYLTNKRIILINPQGKTYVIKLNDIIDYTIQGNSILISVANKNPMKITVNDNFYFDKDDAGDVYAIRDDTFQIANNIRKLKTAA